MIVIVIIIFVVIVDVIMTIVMIIMIMLMMIIIKISISNNIRLGYLVLEFNVYGSEDYFMYITLYVLSKSSGYFTLRTLTIWQGKTLLTRLERSIFVPFKDLHYITSQNNLTRLLAIIYAFSDDYNLYYVCKCLVGNSARTLAEF